jgi:hypothetical protein
MDFLEERCVLLAQVKDSQVILGTEIKRMTDFFCKFFNFFDEKLPPENIHKLPSFYSQLGLKNLLPFSRGNKIRTVEQEFRKLVQGGQFSIHKVVFLMRRLLHFSEIWMMGPIGLWFSIVYHQMKGGIWLFY